MSGSFVTFEGGEGSGKSTQARRIAERHGALFTFQPGATEIGASIRQLLLSTDTEGLSLRAEALLMAADRAQHVDEVIRPALAAGRNVVCDRYMASSLAYQGAGRELGVDQVATLSAFAIDGVIPTLTVLLDVPVDVGLGRIDAAPDRLESLGDGFHRRVRQGYLDLAAAAPERWVVVDAAQGIDEVAAAVDAIVAERLGWRVDG